MPRRESQHAQQGHLQGTAAVRRQWQLATPGQRNLVVKLDLFGGKGLGQGQHLIAIQGQRIGAGPQQLGQGNPMQQAGQLGMHQLEIGPEQGDLIDLGHQGRSLQLRQQLQHLVQVTMIQGAQHGQHLVQVDVATTMGQRLIGQTQGIAHAAIGRLGHGGQRR